MMSLLCCTLREQAMPEVTLESLAARVAELERRLAAPNTPTKDWRSVVGLTNDADFMEQVIEEGRKYRESLRKEAEDEADAEDARLERGQQ